MSIMKQEREDSQFFQRFASSTATAILSGAWLWVCCEEGRERPLAERFRRPARADGIPPANSALRARARPGMAWIGSRFSPALPEAL
jgi:hypothetical protein